jgi:hypothetical protein
LALKEIFEGSFGLNLPSAGIFKQYVEATVGTEEEYGYRTGLPGYVGWGIVSAIFS